MSLCKSLNLHLEGHRPKAQGTNKFRGDQGLPEETRLDVLDQADGVIKELGSSVTDDGKVVRGLRRLGKFISDVASKSAADVVAQLAIAYATARGLA
jgi:hypothetical protein